MTNAKARVSRMDTDAQIGCKPSTGTAKADRDIVSEQLVALGRQIKGILRDALGNHWRRAASLTFNRHSQSIHVSFKVSRRLIDRAEEKFKTLLRDFRATYCRTSRVFALAKHA